MKEKIKKLLFRLPNRRYEAIDPRPLQIPVGMERPESLMAKIQRLVHDETFKQSLQADGIETFEEANDLDPEPEMPTTPYEETFDPKGMIAREQEVRAGVVKDPEPDRLQKAQEVLAKAKAEFMAARAQKRRAADNKGDDK